MTPQLSSLSWLVDARERPAQKLTSRKSQRHFKKGMESMDGVKNANRIQTHSTGLHRLCMGRQERTTRRMKFAANFTFAWGERFIGKLRPISRSAATLTAAIILAMALS